MTRNEQAGNSTGSALSAGDLQRRAVRGSLWTAVHTVVSVPLAFLANAVVARVLGPADYGELAFLTLALGLAVQVTQAGFSVGVVQWGAAAEARGDKVAAEGLLRRSMGFHVLVQMPLLVVAVVVLARDQSWLVHGALLLSVALPAVLSSSTLSLTIENKSAGAAKIAIVSNVVMQASIAVTAVLNGTAAGVWATRSVAASLLLPLNFLLLDKLRRKAVLRLRLPVHLPQGYWRFCAFAWVGGLVGTLVFSRSEVLLLSWLTTPEAVGLFALAYGVSAQITAPVDAVVGPLVPAVAGLLSSHPESAKVAMLRAVRFAALLAGGVTAVALPLFYVAMPLIYGPNYVAAAPLFLVLGAASCFQSICNPVVVFTQGRRRTDVILAWSAVALAVNVGVAFALIPPYGVWGATVANSAGLGTFFVLALRHELRAQGLAAPDFLQAAASWLVALFAAVLAVVVSWVIPLPTLLVAIIVSLAGGMAYAAGLWLTNTGLARADVDAVMGALPSGMASVLRPAVRLVSQRRP